jgi:DNA end-binding protein Ku
MKDHYTEQLRSIIDAKVEGKEVVIVEEEAPKVVDIMTALKASIDAAKKKPMEKAKGETAKKQKAEKPAKAAKRKAS